ncbi:pyridoxamine 5'-phosphate oxidase [Pontibacterium sp.]|uniref:pyridoxamine 5'-phosphate oxidase n=1 Tax=Pontibacterium sp. TaxID=2036026 RepID=UPI003566DC3E
MKFNDLRQNYQGNLQRSELEPDPYQQFESWFEDARHAELIEPNAMSLATVDSNGQPSLRNVLLKHVDDQGFVFFTNLGSRKAQQIEENPRVSLMFSWLGLERQVIISGQASMLSRAETLRYFLLRPRNSQLGAWVSEQSKIISSRRLLEDKFEALKRSFTNSEVPLPKFWGGYRVHPSQIEFWQGGASRLHDRFQYMRDQNDRWNIDRLSP